MIYERIAAASVEEKEASDAAEQVFIDIDRRMKIVSMSERAKHELGSLNDGQSVSALLSPEEAFRLERFVLADPGKKAPTRLEMTFSHLRTHSFAYVLRQDLSSGAAVRIWLFPDRRELLMSPPVMGRFGRLTNTYSDAYRVLDTASEALDRVSVYSASDAGILRDCVMRLYMTGMTGAIVQSVRESVTVWRDPFDLRRATDTAMALIMDSDVSHGIVYRPEGEIKCRFPSKVTFEHFLYLITAAVSSVCTVPHSGKTYCSAVFGEDRFDLSITVNAGDAHLPISGSEGLLSLEELCPSAASRLFLCDVICSECSVGTLITDKDGEVTVRLHLEKRTDSAEFKTRPQLPVTEQVFTLCRAIISGFI